MSTGTISKTLLQWIFRSVTLVLLHEYCLQYSGRLLKLGDSYSFRGTQMLPRFTLPSLILAVCFFSCSAVAQSALSQNSGVNSADTCVTLDLTTQTQNATMTLPSPVYNPATGTTSNVISPTPSPITYHVEAGYDANGGLVMNLWPNGNSLAPSTTGTSVIRLAGGQVTVFDQNSNPLSESLPSGVSSSENLLTSLLGSNPAPALLSRSEE